MDHHIYFVVIALLILLGPAVVALAAHVSSRVCWPHEWRGDQVHRVEVGDSDVRFCQRIICEHCGIVKTRRAGHL